MNRGWWMLLRLSLRSYLGKYLLRLWILLGIYAIILHSCDRILLLRTIERSPAISQQASLLLIPRFAVFFSLLYFFGIILAIGLGAFQIENEIRRKFLLNFLSRNISRAMYLTSRVSAAFLIFVSFSFFSLLLFHWLYPSSEQPPEDWAFYRIFLLLVLFQMLVYSCGLFFSGWIHPVLSAGFTFLLIFLPGFFLFLSVITQTAWLSLLLRILYWILPAFDRVNIAELGIFYALRHTRAFSEIPPDNDFFLFLHLLLYPVILMSFYWQGFRKRPLSGG